MNGAQSTIQKTTIQKIDAFQRRTPPLAFAWAVVKKFGDDSAGSLAALVAYYGFLSLFPLLLVLITILGLVVTPSLSHKIVGSALGQFPIIGQQLTGPNGVHALKAGSVVGLILGLAGLIWGSLGITQAAQVAMAEVWNVRGVERPGFVPKLARGISFLVLLLLDVVATTVLAGFATFNGQGAGARAGAGVVAIVVDAALFVAAFRVLTPSVIRTRQLLGGAIVAGIVWAGLQLGGTSLVAHQLKHTSQIYGYFGSILGLLAFLYLAAEITMYAAELNVVWSRRLYPRSIKPPPLTSADRQVLADIAMATERNSEQTVDVTFVNPDAPWLRADYRSRDTPGTR
ncbi:MAG: YihY/virulence factor BrkB family protein [Acidimicrobiales bacterium]